MYKFSCADFTFPVLNRRSALRLIKLLGIDYVDIGLFARSSHFSPIELQDDPERYTFEVVRDLEVAELKASDVFVQLGIDPEERAANEADPQTRTENRDIFLHALEFCSSIGCRHLTGLPGVPRSTSDKETDLRLAAEEAQWRTSECARAGIQYAIEPHVGSICADVASARKFLRMVEGLTLTLDYGHFVMNGESSETIHSLLPFASHMHVRGGAFDRLQTSVEENTVDFAGMTAGLRRLDYNGFLALEYVWIDWKGCNRTDNISETILLRRELEQLSENL